MAVNWSTGLSSGLGGLGTGAAVGSAGGAIGTGIGAGVGGLLGLLSGLFGGNGNQARNEQLPRFKPNQQSAFDQLLEHSLSGLMPSASGGLSPIAQKATTNFYSNIVPTLSERFTSLGGPGSQGGQRSSAFQGALGQAGAGLSQDIQSNEYNQLFNLLRLGLTPQTENIYHQREPGFFETMGTQTAPQAGSQLVQLLQQLLSKSNTNGLGQGGMI